MTGFPQLIGCGEYVPGTIGLPSPAVYTPTPPRTITIWESTPTIPPFPRRDPDPPDDLIPPIIVRDPSNPFFIPFNPVNPNPPTDPDPDPTLIVGIGGNTRPTPEPPRRTGGDPDLIIGIGGAGLDDPDGGGGGGPTFSEVPTINLADSGGGAGGGGDVTLSDEQMIEYERQVINPNLQLENEGTNNFPGASVTNTIDLRDGSGRSMFSNSFTGNNIYDPIYNILDHSQTPITFVSNSLYRGIFADRVATEISYLIRNISRRANWEERYITGLTQSKLTQSLNSILLEAFDTILDINGVPVTRDYFITRVFQHLISGKLDEFDPNYYIRLADSISKRTANNIVRTVNEQSAKSQAINLIANNSYSADPSNYSEGNEINIARMRFLLTDLESTFDVETIDGTEYQLELEDAGVEVDYAQSLQESNQLTSDYVPPGEGDGYYYKIETELGNLLPLVLDTQLSSAYFMQSAARNLALNLLDQDPSYTVTTTIDLIDSELSSGYNESYTASAHYFKLDLRTINNQRTVDNFIEDITANYVKLTDPDEILEHSKTYGQKVVQFNLQYDDPFLQYADRTGVMTLNMKDVTFRSFNPRRTPARNGIITRNLPDGFVVYPVNTIKDNPLGAYSTITSLNTQVTRSLKAVMDFSMTENDLRKRTLRRSVVWDNEGSFRYGLIGIDNSENVYYTYDANDFPNRFDVSGRSEVGNLVYNVINQTLEQKYSFDYLTWWDVYRRLSTKDFAKLAFNFPDSVSTSLYQGWLSYPIQDVLYRDGAAPDNLTEVNSSIEDPIYLDGRSRNNV